MSFDAKQRDGKSELKDMFGSGGQLGYLSNATKTAGTSMMDLSQEEIAKLFPQLQSAQNTGTSSARATTLADLNSMGSDYVHSLTNASPLLATAQNRLTGMVGTAGDADPLAQELNASALENLRLGSSLSQQQIRGAVQGTRAGLADRGMVMGNNAIGAEILSRDGYGQQLLAQRQNTALGVENQNLQRIGQGQNFVLGANQAGQTLANTGLGLLSGTTGVNVNSLTNFVNPTAAVTAGANATNALMNYQADVNSSNLNAAVDAQRQKNNMYSALAGSTIGALGNVGAAFI